MKVIPLIYDQKNFRWWGEDDIILINRLCKLCFECSIGLSAVFYENLHLLLTWDLYNHSLKTTVTIIKLWSHCVNSRLPFFTIADIVSWIASIIIIMKGSSYSLRVMKNARNKGTHHLPQDQHQLGAASIAMNALQTIPSRGTTPAQTPDEVSFYPTFCINHYMNIQLFGLFISTNSV